MRRGRRDSEKLHVGDTVDCWRVEVLEPNHRLRLEAEMKVPGRAWLEFEVTAFDGKSTIRQTASFDPVGLLGRAYWYLVYPLHQYVFAGMLRGIAKNAGKPVLRTNEQPMSAGCQWLALAVFLVICLGTAALGAAVTNLSVRDWYATLEKPSWSPPNWLFGPVWTTLYIGMAVAAWLVWRKRGLAQGWLPLTLFGIQLTLNAIWSVLFFGFRSPGAAFVEIILLWFAILATIIVFARHSALAAALLVPYLAWVSFATALNSALWWMNS